jgi:hypothetical protein
VDRGNDELAFEEVQQRAVSLVYQSQTFGRDSVLYPARCYEADWDDKAARVARCEEQTLRMPV